MTQTPAASPLPRTATVNRSTKETAITVSAGLDGTGHADIATGLGFFDHMLTALARHSGFDLTIKAAGDLDVDDHHTIEDTALALGRAIDQALSDRAGIERFASAHAPLDESLARVVLDLSGRPGAWVDLRFTRETLGDTATENLAHFFVSLASGLRATLHADLIRGENDHHKAEAAFKALALALRLATRRTRAADDVPSTKGTLG